MSESFAELFENSIQQQSTVGKLMKANVVAVEKDFVIVNTGLKSEALVPINEYRNKDGDITVTPGEETEVTLESIDDGLGRTIVSHERARYIRMWEKLRAALETNEVIDAAVTGRVKGGFTVNIDVVRAFLPFSLAGVRPPVGGDFAVLEGDIQCRVIKMDESRNNIVVSRRAVLEEQNSNERRAILSQLQPGNVFKGVVKNITDYGAFIDLGGVDGLLHITDIAWERVSHPSEVVNIGDSIEVVVIDYDPEKGRISLGRKQLLDDPWDGLEGEFPVGAKVAGKVVKITNYGCFVEIKPGIEGLVHTSELDWTNRNVHAKKLVQIGDAVDVVILDINKEGRRISLSIKQALPNPWEEFALQHQRGEKVEGVIKSITDFGLFVGLDNGVDGLVHLGDLDWHLPSEEAIKKYKKGERVTTVILGVKIDERRISLGIKQLEQDAFSVFLATNGKGGVISGEVTHVDGTGVTLRLADGVDGFIRTADLSRDRIDDPTKYFNIGQIVSAKIVNVDRKERVFHLSIREKDRDDEKEAVKSYSGLTEDGPKLGDLLKSQMAEQQAADEDTDYTNEEHKS